MVLGLQWRNRSKKSLRRINVIQDVIAGKISIEKAVELNGGLSKKTPIPMCCGGLPLDEGKCTICGGDL